MTDRERALVLGGGGSAGNAWEGGLDVTGADLIVGTSAGSTAAAQITSGLPPPAVLAQILTARPPPQAGGTGPDRGGMPRPAADHMERTGAVFAAAKDATDLRRRMGAAALQTEAASDPGVQARWRAAVASRLPSQDWPARAVR